MSSQALQYWVSRSNTFSSNGKGLYETGGSGYAVRLVRCLFKMLGLNSAVQQLCQVSTLNEQREMWPRIRRVLMSAPLHWTVLGTEWFAWKALGVPPNQRKLIQQDYIRQEGLNPKTTKLSSISGAAMWNYVVHTLDPVVQHTLLSNDNYFYLLCLQGRYSRR